MDHPSVEKWINVNITQPQKRRENCHLLLHCFRRRMASQQTAHYSSRKESPVAARIAQWVREPAAKPTDNLSLIPRSHMVGEPTHKVVL